MMVRQNKWRAARFGNSARLVHARLYRVQSVEEIACDLVNRLRDVAVDLGCESELLFVKEIAGGEGWAERQRSIMESTSSPAEIVSRLSSQARVTDYDAIIK